MSFTDWNSGNSLSTPRQQHGFICMSTTVDELSYTPSEQERSRDAAQIEATGRRSWKTIRGKGEAVWPPNLEAALIEALERYHPEATGSRSNKYAGRFPMRNKFISDYIFETTGKRRTPKQVGSRLQQLRDTCKEDRILHLISHAAAGLNSGSSHSEGSVCTSMSPPPEFRELVARSTDLHVEITVPKELWPAPTPSIHLISNDRENPQRIQLSPSACIPQGQQSAKSSMSSFLRSLSGSVEFLSQCALALQSNFIVYMEGSVPPIHSEAAPLRCISSPMQRSGWLYSSDLAPGFWDTLISSPDLSRYTILQVLRPMASGEPACVNNLDNARRTSHTISVFYKFKVPEVPRRCEPAPRAAQSTGYLGSNQSVPSSRQATSSLGYCQWQPDALDSDASNYQLVSNTRGDVPSTLLGPTNSIPQASTSYAHHPSSSNYVPMQTGSTKYETVDGYEEYSNSTYYTPHDNGWTDQLTPQTFQSPQPWASGYY